MPFKPSNSLSTDESAKFDLYLKAREMRQISDALQQVMLLSKEDRATWLEEHGELVAESFDDFIDQSNLTFDDLVMDDEALELSRDLVLSLREALSTVHGMLHGDGELES